MWHEQLICLRAVETDGFDADCNSVYGAEIGDSCNSVVEKFGLSSLDFFLSINPNCNCDAFFEGQWLCVDGNPNEWFASCIRIHR